MAQMQYVGLFAIKHVAGVPCALSRGRFVTKTIFQVLPSSCSNANIYPGFDFWPITQRRLLPTRFRPRRRFYRPPSTAAITTRYPFTLKACLRAAFCASSTQANYGRKQKEAPGGSDVGLI